MSKLNNNISRKSFLVGGAAALAGVAAMGMTGTLSGCAGSKTLSGIDPKDFESSGLASFKSGLENVPSAKVPTKLYTIKNDQGAELCITNVGARIVSLMVPDKNGNKINVVLGFKKLSDYIDYNKDQKNYYGAVVGRYANRIGKGQFNINGEQFQVSTNEKGNMLHGGEIGFNYAAFEEEVFNKKALCLRYTSPDGEMGFPGELTLKVTYTLNDQNTIGIYYEATCTKACAVNFSNHAYFILSGDVNHPIKEDNLFIVSDKTTEINQDLIPTGNILESEEGGPFDFFGTDGVYYKSGGRDTYSKIDKSNQQIKYAKGYDHNFAIMSVAEAAAQGFNSAREFQVSLDNSDDIKKDGKLVACASSPKTGIKMEIVSTEPGLQFYDCNSCDGSTVGLNGPFNKYCAFVLEPQHYPDSPNHSNFPNTILQPGEVYKSKSEYRFSLL